MLRRVTFVTTKVTKIILWSITVRTQKNNAIRSDKVIFITSLFCRLQRNSPLLCRYFSVLCSSLPIKASYRVPFSKALQESRCLTPSSHKYFVYPGSVFVTSLYLLRSLRSDSRFPLCLLLLFVLREAP